MKKHRLKLRHHFSIGKAYNRGTHLFKQESLVYNGDVKRGTDVGYSGGDENLLKVYAACAGGEDVSLCMERQIREYGKVTFQCVGN